MDALAEPGPSAARREEVGMRRVAAVVAHGFVISLLRRYRSQVGGRSLPVRRGSWPRAATASVVSRQLSRC